MYSSLLHNRIRGVGLEDPIRDVTCLQYIQYCTTSTRRDHSPKDPRQRVSERLLPPWDSRKQSSELVMASSQSKGSLSQCTARDMERTKTSRRSFGAPRIQARSLLRLGKLQNAHATRKELTRTSYLHNFSFRVGKGQVIKVNTTPTMHIEKSDKDINLTAFIHTRDGTKASLACQSAKSPRFIAPRIMRTVLMASRHGELCPTRNLSLRLKFFRTLRLVEPRMNQK